ncbi:hypothetical protein SDC9_156825 [bioreactor metagenome]|uniref:Uncharacterized protein n=1 Tax=bioreactor metagenome TaxID=1076179 RepID=A0A645FAF0_9ZZZZ
MHEFGGVDQLVGLGAHFLAHALETAAAGLQVGHADHIVVAHGHCETVGHRTGQCPGRCVAAMLGVERADLVHAVEILGGVGQILEVDQAAQARHQHAVGAGRKVALDAIEQGLGGRAGCALRHFGCGP